MQKLDNLIARIPPGSSITVRADMIGLSDIAFHTLAREIEDDGGADDCDLVKVHRLGETGFQQLGEQTQTQALAALIDAVTLRRHK